MIKIGKYITFNLIYQNSMIPTINKPTRFTRKIGNSNWPYFYKLFHWHSLQRQQFSKLTYLTISQFVIYHRILYHKKIKTEMPSYIKEHLTLNVSSPLSRNYMKLSGMEQKVKILTKHINTFLKTFVTLRSPSTFCSLLLHVFKIHFLTNLKWNCFNSFINWK